MRQPIWVPVGAVRIIHDRQIARHGGASGLRDEGLLQNAMQRPVNKWQYEDADTLNVQPRMLTALLRRMHFLMETNGLHS